MLTQPSATYALGIALVSFAFLKRWCQERRPRLLAASVALAAGLLLFRAQIFLLALPCVLATAAIATVEFRRRRLLYVGAALALLIVLYLIVDGQRALRPFLATVHDQPAIAYAGWYDSLLRRYGARVALPLGVLLVFPVFLGAFTLLYPIALWLRHRSAFDAVPLLLIAGYAALVKIRGGSLSTTEIHRKFGWRGAGLLARVLPNQRVEAGIRAHELGSPHACR